MSTGINLAQPLTGASATKAYTYDNSVYTTIDELDGNIAAAVNSACSFTAVAQKQVKSVTLVPTTAGNADQVSLTLYSLYAQAFGTATGMASPSLAGGTATSTSYNKVTVTLGTGASFTAYGALSPVYNPIYTPISGAKGTVIVAGPGGTNTQGGYVFPTGPNGGLTMNPGDVLVLAKATDSLGIFAVTIETQYTPGSSFTA